MEQIIADKTLETAKQFIQNNIRSSHLTQEVRNRFIELYGSLNTTNAAAIYTEAHQLNGQLINAIHRQHNADTFKFGATVLFISVVLFGLRSVCKYFKLLPNYINTMEHVIGGIAILGISIILSVGH